MPVGNVEAKFSISQRQAGNPALVLGYDVIKGTRRFVDSNASSGGNGLSWDGAHTTLAAAITACATDDVIFVAPAHAENVATAAAITVDKAGISIIGLGNKNRRPTFTWSGTAGTISVTAADVLISNIVCTASVDEVVSMWSISGKRVTLDRVDYVETSGSTTIQFLVTTAAADDFTLQNCDHRVLNAAASAQLWINIVGSDFSRIIDNVFSLVLSNDATSTAINYSTTASIQVLIARNYICQTGGTTQDNFISLVTATTGLAADNRIGGDVGTLAASVDLASVYGSENFVATTVNKSGILDPVVA